MKRSITVVLVSLMLSSSAFALDLDIKRVAEDTQRFNQDGNSMDLVWWIPNEYWEAAFQSNPGITEAQQKEFISVVDEYFVCSILEGTLGPFGGLTGTSRDDLLRKTTLVLSDGVILNPLRDDQLSADVSNFLKMMKPMFANMLGQMGSGMEFILFQGKNRKGERHAVPNEKGSFTVKLGEKEFSWRLPLGAFLPPKYDSKTGEEFPGNFIYSPFTGERLTSKAPKK